ncbi:LppU/SCO3897 family protein [Streptomyces halobius]|uniref:Uncharacterized protein n=1 Tax=Streptomyces halobius TaxID=2879846 RepID=A0ABY4M3U5_9ACTN|nr:hypothetical protein [Streptomyces halobius]UQA92434.1 hypothetical protein K9S39_11835 [Streptomyces halobius]
MSAPPPYQNQPPQQQYGYPQQQYGHPQQQHGQPQYGRPQPPRGPQRPQRSPLRALISVTVVLAVFGGVAWYVWDYNTHPNGGKAKAEASRSAQAEENEKYNPEEGDCVRILDAHGDNPTPEIVDCNSPEAEYKTGEQLSGTHAECESPPYDTSIHYSGRSNYTLCFTKL